MAFFKQLIPIKLPANYLVLSQSERRDIRERYIALQHGRCHHCECDLDGEPSSDVTKLDVTSDLFPLGFFKHPVHLHHNHGTGMTIGAVHAYCNAVLWEHEGE